MLYSAFFFGGRANIHVGDQSGLNGPSEPFLLGFLVIRLRTLLWLGNWLDTTPQLQRIDKEASK